MLRFKTAAFKIGHLLLSLLLGAKTAANDGQKTAANEVFSTSACIPVQNHPLEAPKSNSGASPTVENGSAARQVRNLGTPLAPLTPIKISYEYVVDDIKFLETSVICYVLCANTPLRVIEGFVKRIWNPSDIDKVGTIAKGVILVHLKSHEAIMVACDSNGILFDKKPFIVKLWTKNASYEKESVTTIPVWVRFPGLSMHY